MILVSCHFLSYDLRISPCKTPFVDAFSSSANMCAFEALDGICGFDCLAPAFAAGADDDDDVACAVSSLSDEFTS